MRGDAITIQGNMPHLSVEEQREEGAAIILTVWCRCVSSRCPRCGRSTKAGAPVTPTDRAQCAHLEAFGAVGNAQTPIQVRGFRLCVDGRRRGVRIASAEHLVVKCTPQNGQCREGER